MKIYLEGKADEILVRCLGVSKKLITQKGAKTNVIKRVVKETGVVGIVDEDWGYAQAGYFKQFTIKEEKHHLRIYHHQQNGNKLIAICPVFEAWLLNLTKNAKVDITTFKLSDTSKKLHKEIISSNTVKLEQFIHHLLAKQNKPLLYLKSFLVIQ